MQIPVKVETQRYAVLLHLQSRLRLVFTPAGNTALRQVLNLARQDARATPFRPPAT